VDHRERLSQRPSIEPQNLSQMPRFLARQWVDLTLIQLTNLRWSWKRSLVVGAVVPVVSIITFGSFVSDGDQELYAYVLTGNVVLSLLFETVGKVSSRFAFMRLVGMLDYLTTLPVYSIMVVLATVVAFLLLSLPSLFLTIIAGVWILDVELAISPWIALVVPLIAFSLCGLGALLGLLGRTPEEVASLSTLTTFILFAVGPVLIPASRLPQIFNYLSLLSPATYAASALRHTLLGTRETLSLALDLTVLAAITFFFLWLVRRRMQRRELL